MTDSENGGTAAKTDEWKDDPRTKQLAYLLLECRDALPAISLASAKLRGIDLSLADRIREALKPWEVAEGEDGI